MDLKSGPNDQELPNDSGLENKPTSTNYRQSEDSQSLGTQTSLDQTFRESIVGMFDSMKQSFMLRYVVSRISAYSGLNMPFENFVHDVRSGEAFLHAEIIPEYITALFFKLKDPAREHAYNRTFTTVDDFLNHLKDKFEPEFKIPPRTLTTQGKCSTAHFVTIRDLY